MERQYHREDFERLLRDNANQYRMYPSEKVWKGIYSTLHTRRRWYGLSALLLLLVSITAITYTVLNNNERSLTGISQNVVKATETISNRQILADRNPDKANLAPITPEKNTIGSRQPVFNPENEYVYNILTAVRTEPVVVHVVFDNSDESPNDDQQLQKLPTQQLISTSSSPKVDVNAAALSVPPAVEDPTISQSSKVEEQEENNSTPVIKEDEAQKKDPEELQQEISALASQHAPIQVKGKPAKLTAQVYFTPTISYRKLSENKAYTRAASSLNPSYQYTQYIDVNNVVNHKPAMGLELGIEGRYAITDRIAVKIGGQFNINRYDIRAYFHPTEFATIALNSGSGPDSLMTLSNYRNFNGAAPNWLENFYFTASVPLGADFIIFDNKKIQWGISGSVQPSYVIGDRAYLISKDYKNYAKVKNLMRNMNISTDFETFISYSTGRMRWQVGPQIRYQHLSSFVNEYPVKENLFDIGLKIGASINKR